MKFDPSFCHNEREVESKLIVSYLLPKLGYSLEFWRQERKLNRFRLDFSAYTDSEVKTDVVFEAKHPNQNLNDHLQQLKDYMLKLQIPYGMLTNGKEIAIYRNVGNNILRIFHCWGRKIEDNIDKINSLIGKDTLARELKLIGNNMKIIAVYHNKGGVGKTTTVVNLAATFSKMGKRVLVIDLDSQANTTFATGLVNFGDEEKDDLKDNY
ncbi:MAG TPA: ParA family protein, partial [Thioploca sp.]|nr:ParA family protein [Thioploca sp.]